MVGKMERKWQLIIFFIAMILLSAGGYCYMNSEVTAPPEMTLGNLQWKYLKTVMLN